MIDLNLLSENPVELQLTHSDILKLRGKRKTVLPVVFPIDYYLDSTNNIKENEEANFASLIKQSTKTYNSSNGRYIVGL